VEVSTPTTDIPVFTANNLPKPDTDWKSGAVFVVDKPYHWTSFRVVGLIRKLIGIKKVGHAGTLDPLATGLLIVCTGKATKMIEELMAGTKGYRATITLGASTPSYDSETEITQTATFDHVTKESVEKILASNFSGPIQQIPPMYSAVKHKGTPLYKMARVGKEIERKVRHVEIFSADLVNFESPNIVVDIHCSKGTYIRSIAHDIGPLLGTLSYLTGLSRTKNGKWTIDQAMSVQSLLTSLDPNGESGISL
jgi:tRNA pseudouridine55 synthase